MKYHLPKLRMHSHHWRDHGCGFCLECEYVSVTGSVCLKPLASVSELNEYLFLPLLRSGSLSGLWEASELNFQRVLWGLKTLILGFSRVAWVRVCLRVCSGGLRTPRIKVLSSRINGARCPWERVYLKGSFTGLKRSIINLGQGLKFQNQPWKSLWESLNS